MKRTFIFDKEKDRWIEESEILLFHDILAIFDEESHSIYLWKGPRIKEAKTKRAKERLTELISTISEVKWTINEDKKTFPLEVQKLLDSMLEPTRERKKEDRLKFSHFYTIRLTFLLLVGIVVIHILSIITVLVPLFKPTEGTSFLITAVFYEFWLTIYQVFVVISLILCISNLIIGLFERDIELIIFSLIGIIINIGIILYTERGIFLFLHQSSSTPSMYLILISEMTIFSILNLTTLLIALLPNFYKLLRFIKVYRKFIYISSKELKEDESR